MSLMCNLWSVLTTPKNNYQNKDGEAQLNIINLQGTTMIKNIEKKSKYKSNSEIVIMVIEDGEHKGENCTKVIVNC